MDTYQNPYMMFPGITPEEMGLLQQATAELSDSQKKYFYMVYADRRKSPQDILLFTLIGLFGIAGVQRFVLGEVIMGVLYFFTAGFCFVGTIVDLINYKNLTSDYNRKIAFESFHMAKMSNQ
jgi:TM2 domain-containing membrane protein YozV